MTTATWRRYAVMAYVVMAGIGNRHLAQLSEIVSALAVKLGIVPEVGWFEEVITKMFRPFIGHNCVGHE